MKKYRSWNVEVVSNGFIVTIGCQKVVAETPEKLLYLTKGYLEDPGKAEKELFENHIALNGNPESVEDRTERLNVPQTCSSRN